MLISLGIIFIVGILLKKVSERLFLPGLIGLLVTGIVLGPYVSNLIDQSVLELSSIFRQLALIIIIFRAGLNLNLKELMKNKLTIILLSFVPATFEIASFMFVGSTLLKLSLLDSAILGCVISAVSPAVIVPSMIKIIDNKYGVKKGIPQMIMSAASVDDIYVITLFLALINVSVSNAPLDLSIVIIMLQTIIFGVLVGLVVGYTYNKVMKYFKLSEIYSLLIIISILFIIDGLEPLIENYVGYSSLLSILSFGAIVNVKQYIHWAFTEMWSIFEILLFVLIGAQLDLSYVVAFGLIPIIAILISLVVRSVGVYVAMLGSSLNFKERLFVIFSFIPKATVQAAIGPIALSVGLASGELILTVAILSILISAPLGYFLINKSYNKLLSYN